MSVKSIEQVLKDQTDSLMSIKGVVGVGQGELNGSPCIVVFLAEDRGDIKAKIPKELDGYKVKIEVSGEFKAW